MPSVVLAVFQCLYPHTFIMQPTGPLQRTAYKATSKNLKFSFLENNRVLEGLIEKFILAFSTTPLQLTFDISTTIPSLAQYRK